MKILFLDIDGVLNNDQTTERCNNFTGVDKRLAAKLRSWLRVNPEVKIVLSSTWRTDESMWYAIRAEQIDWIDVTPRLGTMRGREIQQWLDARSDITHYAILDDSSDMLSTQLKFFVQTDERKGVTEYELKKLDAIFSDTPEQ